MLTLKDQCYPSACFSSLALAIEVLGHSPPVVDSVGSSDSREGGDSNDGLHINGLLVGCKERLESEDSGKPVVGKRVERHGGLVVILGQWSREGEEDKSKLKSWGTNIHFMAVARTDRICTPESGSDATMTEDPPRSVDGDQTSDTLVQPPSTQTCSSRLGLEVRIGN